MVATVATEMYCWDDEWDGSYAIPLACWDDPYDGDYKVYPESHGVVCSGHRDYATEMWGRWRDPDSRPLPDPTKWWGKLKDEEVVNVNPRYL